MRILILLMLLIGSAAHAQRSPIFLTKGTAIHGYDAVAFFTKGEPVKGDSSISAQWQGANWWFATAANKAQFLQNPEAYAPQYGGYCAYGASEGHKAPTQIETWTIVDNKLYFNYSPKVKTLWNKDIPGHISKANANWPAIKDKP